MVPNGHELAGPGPLAPEQLARYPAILPGEITFTRRLVDEFFHRQQLNVTTAFATDYLETTKMMVSFGLGWSVLPQTMVDGELTRLEVSGFRVNRTLGVVRYANHTLSNAAVRMLLSAKAQKKAMCGK